MNEKRSGTERASAPALRTPYKMLLFTAFLLPCLNVLAVGSAMLITNYFGAFYSYTAGGTVLTLLYEILSSLFNVVGHCLMICSLMTLASYLFKKNAKDCILPALFAFCGGFAEIVCSTLTLTATVSLGISDSTAALPSQLIPLIIGSLASLLLRAPFFLLTILLFLIVKKKSADLRTVCYERTPFALSSLTVAGIYTLYLFIDPITVVLSPAEGGNLFSNYVLPFLYPLIYGGFMVLTVLLFPRYLTRYYKRVPVLFKKGSGKSKAARTGKGASEQRP